MENEIRNGLCGCGCGLPVARRFRPGHDARLKGRLLRMVRTGTEEERLTARTMLRHLGWEHFIDRAEAARGTARSFGVEMEVEHSSYDGVIREFQARNLAISFRGYTHETTRYWKIVTDGSVRGGFEVVSPVLRGERGMRELKVACEALQAAGAKINKTCGLHVHHGVSDLAKDEIVRVAKSYSAMQTSIDEIMPSSRKTATSNHYCQPLSRHDFELMDRVTTLSDFVSYGGSRYRTVNLCSFPRIGTIEFRQHSGSVEFAKISAWIRFGQALIEAIKRGERPTAMADVLTDDDLAFYAARARTLRERIDRATAEREARINAPIPTREEYAQQVAAMRAQPDAWDAYGDPNNEV